MNKGTKILFLGLTLVLPVLVFLFLKEFGVNKYAIPVMFENGMESELSCLQGKEQHRIPEFAFPTHTGDTITEQFLEGHITVADFFFTSCPSICPVMTNELTRVQDAFKGDEEVKIMSFTVDPMHDTPEVLAEYADRNYADPNQWLFITGEKQDLYRLARCGYVLPVQDGDGGPDDFIHSPRFVLVDKEKRIRGFYVGTDRKEVDRLITEIKILKQEYEN